MKMVICHNCGAKIHANDTECPYCKAMQYDAAEKKYMNDLYEMNNNMDHLDEDALKYIRKQTIRYVLITIAAILVAVGIGYIWGMRKYIDLYNSKQSRAKITNSFSWYNENIDMMNHYVETGDYRSAADLFNNYKGTGELLRQWEHYSIIYVYKTFYDSFDFRYGYIESGKKIEAYEFDSIYDNAMDCLAVFSGKQNYSYARYASAPDEDKKRMDLWREKIDLFFTKYVGITKEQYMKDLDQLYSDGYGDHDLQDNLEDKYYQMYLERN